MRSRSSSKPHPLQHLSSSLLKGLQEHRQFASAVLANPAGMGAVAPSGAALAAAITAPVQSSAGKVLELGSGTGVFTRHLLRMGVDPARLILVEQDARLCAGLRRQFPGATVLEVSAQDLAQVDHPAVWEIDATICGLPLLNMSEADRRRLLASVFEVMRPGGAMHLFTYGPRCPISAAALAERGLAARRVRFVPFNLPPAFVFEVRRPCPSAGSGGPGRVAAGTRQPGGRAR